MSTAVSRVHVVVELAKKRSFASAIDWPGWCRSGHTPDAAMEALAAYALRYEPVATRARLTFPRVAGTESLAIVEEVVGDATTEFGAPSTPATSEVRPNSASVAHRVAALLEAAWNEFDDVVASTPAHLRKGPRGGGRDRDAMIDHVLGAEQAYAAKIGVRARQPSANDRGAIRAMREAMLAVVRSDRTGASARERGWSPRYCARRLAWHALDHAWEMQDRSS